MRKVVVSGVVILAVLGGALWLLRSRGKDSARVGLDSSVASADERTAAAADRLRERLRVSAQPALPAARGALEIRGRVLGPHGPATGATVTATLEEDAAPPLSARPCHCGNSCPRKLMDCGCGEAADELLSLAVERPGEAPPMALATAAADGTFVLAGLEARAYTLRAVAAAGVGMREDVPAGSTDVEVSLAEGMRLHGKVLDEEKKPISGAVVTAMSAAGSRYFDALSGSDGRFELGPLPGEQYSLVAAHGALLSASMKAREGSTDELVLVLHRPRRLAGRVLRSEAAVAGASVRLEGEHRKEQVQADAEGAFFFTRLRPGEYSVVAAHGTDVAGVTAYLEETGEPTPLVLRLEAGAELDGRVAARGGGPVEGAQVFATSEARGKEPRLDASTDARGTFRLAPVSPGKVSLEVHASGYLLVELTRMLPAGERAHLEVVLEPAAVLSGRVLAPGGQPVQEAHVRVQILAPAHEQGTADSVTTDEQGAFRIDSLQAGHARLEVTHPEFKRVQREVDVPATGLEVTLEAGLGIRGRVVDEDGQALAGASVTIACATPAPDGEEPHDKRLVVEADEQGRFHAGGLEPGRHVLGATAPGKGASRRGGRMEVVLPSEAEVVLRLAAGLSLTGRVVDEAGAPVAEVSLAASAVAEDEAQESRERPVLWDMLGGSRVAVTTSRDDGTFAFEHLAPGNYRLAVQTERYELVKEQPATAAAGASDVRLVVGKAPRVLGRVLGPDGTPLRRFTLNGRTFASAEGTFEYPVWWRQGKMTLWFDGGPGLAPVTRTVQPPARGDLDLGDVVLTAGGAVTGRVVDAQTGAPVAGALVDVGDPPRVPGVAPYMSVGRGAVRTAVDGSFTLPNAGAQASYLFVQHDEYLELVQPLGSRTGLLLSLRRGGVVEGSVRLASGQGVRAQVWFLGERRASARSGIDGRFRATGLAPGEYTVRVEFRDEHEFPPTVVRVQGTETVAVDISERQGGVTVRVRVEGGKETYALLVPGAVAVPENFDALLKIAATTFVPDRTRQGTRFHLVPPGRHTIVFGTEVGRKGLTVQMQEVEVMDAPDQAFTVRLDPAAKWLSFGPDSEDD